MLEHVPPRVRAWAARWGPEAGREFLRTWPLALVLLLVLGGTLYIGPNLSNAYPSQAKPFGWPGAATFDGGVATVRRELLLGASMPALMIGLRAVRRQDRRSFVLGRYLSVVGVDAGLIMVAVWGSACVGEWAASKTTSQGFWAFTVAHILLALAMYSIAVFLSMMSRRVGVSAGIGLWLGFVAVFDDLLYWRLFRTVGYTELKAGHLPAWFLASQAASPLAAYRGVLILWRPGFRDYTEHAALDGATLPAWANPATFALFLLVVWILLPLEIAALVGALRSPAVVPEEGALVPSWLAEPADEPGSRA